MIEQEDGVGRYVRVAPSAAEIGAINSATARKLEDALNGVEEAERAAAQCRQERDVARAHLDAVCQRNAELEAKLADAVKKLAEHAETARLNDRRLVIREGWSEIYHTILSEIVGKKAADELIQVQVEYISLLGPMICSVDGQLTSREFARRWWREQKKRLAEKKRRSTVK